MMKCISYVIHVLIFSCCLATSLCWAHGGVENHALCSLCGSDRNQYLQSRGLIQYDEGSTIGTCSIHCAALGLVLNRDKTVAKHLVADYSTTKLIDARKTFWVIGGSRAGAMTVRAKWAFGKRSQAESFTSQYGGQISAFDDVMKATFQDMYKDVRLIR